MLRQLKPHELDEMEQAYRAGSSSTELAARFGVDRTTVTRRLRLQGVKIRMPEPILSPEAVQEVAALYEGGWSLSQLGEKFGISTGTVRNSLKWAGVTIRPPTGG